ncbi:MAG: hypothetical protein DHS20C17_04320 [Cyclobacteriaceae bacterium]|nr:MAG: hypothetical protein DHS20C17_04320 [Cyclobacteriaceae bacterium]
MALACSDDVIEKPENLMTKGQMTAFLIDSHLIEGNLQTIKIDQDSLEKIFYTLEKDLYKKHKIDSEQFMLSYHYYLHQTNELSEIYDAVIDSLSLQEKMINSAQ